jgi:hypothetical protein
MRRTNSTARTVGIAPGSGTRLTALWRAGKLEGKAGGSSENIVFGG